jgi:hypothetical protein
MEKGKEGLDKAYDDTVSRIENRGQGIHELAKKALFWIVYAKRPLTTEELRHVVHANWTKRISVLSKIWCLPVQGWSSSIAT